MDLATEKLQDQFSASLRKLSLLFGRAPDSFLVAVSGGIDSMVLLELFRAAGLEFVVAHFDHGLRARSGADASFVADYCREKGLKCVVQKAEPYSGEENLEAWARENRYRFLERVRQQHRAELIVTAHHQRDQAETVLFKLFSGRADTPFLGVSFYCKQRLLFRPLLDSSKELIEATAKELGLPFVEDETNLDLSRSRNWIRSEILPRIKKSLNSRIEHSLAVVGNYLREDDECLNQQAQLIAKEISNPPLQQELSELAPALGWRVLREVALECLGEEAKKISRKSYSRLLAAVSDSSTEARKVELGFGFFADCSQGAICFVRQESQQPLAAQRLNIDGGGVKFGDLVLSARLLKRGEVFELSADSDESLQYFDARLLGDKSLIVRKRVDGDTIRIANRGGRKLKKMFQEQGLMLTLRDRAPIVECDGSILWVPGVARSEIAPVTENTTDLLELTCYKFSSINLAAK